MKSPIAWLALMAVVPAAQAADIDAGKARASTVCAACHGANGVSVAGFIPNLAGQKADYLGAQLHAFKDGDRKDDLMGPIAGQLADDEIDDVAAFFASLPGAAVSSAQSDLLPAVATSRVSFPADFPAGFTRYLRMNFPDNQQVRHFYANRAALEAARKDAPLPDGSMILVEVYGAKLDAEQHPIQDEAGFFVAGELKGYAAMARQPGWGDGIPEMLRNENWNYTALTTDKTQRSGLNQAVCFACHKPQSGDSHLFTMKELRERAHQGP